MSNTFTLCKNLNINTVLVVIQVFLEILNKCFTRPMPESTSKICFKNLHKVITCPFWLIVLSYFNVLTRILNWSRKSRLCFNVHFTMLLCQSEVNNLATNLQLKANRRSISWLVRTYMSSNYKSALTIAKSRHCFVTFPLLPRP